MPKSHTLGRSHLHALCHTFTFTALLGLACLPPPVVRPDAGAPASDAGVGDAGLDAGEVDAGPAQDAGPHAPKATIFAFGIVDNTVRHEPQAAPYVALTFGNGTPGPSKVVSRRVSTPPTLDGLDTDWAGIVGSDVRLVARGVPVGMSEYEWVNEYARLGRPTPFDFETYEMYVASAFDDDNIYFLFQWVDPTESGPAQNALSQVDAGWARNNPGGDRLLVGFDVSFPAFALLGCAAGCHVRERLADFTDAGIAYRFTMHTNGPGQIANVWSWSAQGSDPMGQVDNRIIDEVNEKPSSTLFTLRNYKTVDGGLQPLFMGEDGVNSNPLVIYAPDAGRHPMAVPYDPTGLLPTSTIPAVVHQPSTDQTVRAGSHWKHGIWTVEIARPRTTPNPTDAQFP
jgi:hypothetical protein